MQPYKSCLSSWGIALRRMVQLLMLEAIMLGMKLLSVVAAVFLLLAGLGNLVIVVEHTPGYSPVISATVAVVTIGLAALALWSALGKKRK
jgi:hypothetical protein